MNPAAEEICRLRRAGAPEIVYGLTRARAAPRRGVVILLHGLASNMTRWSEFLERTELKQAWDVIRVDLRGHGGSETRGPISLELWSKDLAALLSAQGCEQAVLVGHSLGAQAALHFAGVAPQRVQGLALIDPVFREALRGKWQRLARYGGLFALAARIVRVANALGLRRRYVPPLDLRALDDMARRSLLDPASEAEFIRRYSSTRADLKTFRTAHYLQELVEMFRPVPPPASLAMPALVLLSTGATFADLTQTQAIAQGFPQGQVTRVECHHWPLTEKPDEVRQLIEAWCAALPGPAPGA